MSKTIKGALAALTAAILLLGGVGSLAFWTDAEDVPGTGVSSGQLDLGTPNCGTGWTLDGGALFTTQQIVPGDSITEVCTIDLVASGAHIGADLGIGTPTWTATNGLTTELTPSATFTVNGVPSSHITDADDTGAGEIVATVSVVFNGPGATNGSENLSATLETITITATQTHDPV
jgi:alternate signal-mediated exported protein